MSTDLFQALTLGLLVIVILALLVAVSMLGRIRAHLEGRSTGSRAGTVTSTEEAASLGGTALIDSASGNGAAAIHSGREEIAGELADSAGDATSDGDSERPFERAGRWYFMRAGELLVYEEGTGEWVPAGEDVAASEDEGAAESSASEDAAGQAEAVEASGEPAVVEQDSVVEQETTEDAAVAEPSTSFAGQPLADAEQDVAHVGGTSPEGGDEAAMASGFEEPGGGSVDLQEAMEPTEATDDMAGKSADSSFWKCPSCGAINGSTATSCRMCFAARP